MKKQHATVLNDSDESVEVIATHIKNVAEAAKKIVNGPLTMRALCVLIHDAIKGTKKPGIRDIQLILEVAGSLDRQCIRKVEKPKDAH